MRMQHSRYDGGVMLFLDWARDSAHPRHEWNGVPLEMRTAVQEDRSYEIISARRNEEVRQKKWKKHVEDVVNLFSPPECEYVVLGGGNVRFFDELRPIRAEQQPECVRGGYRLWQKQAHLP